MGLVKYITVEEYQDLALKNPYWIGRWPYMSKVVELIKNLPINESSAVLELGAYECPIVKDSDIMDITDFILEYKNPTPNIKYNWDATNVPWPIEDKKYTLFIALQVWEHLNGKQKEAFEEVIRVSKYAILSFPYNWKNCIGDCHYGITDEIIAEWTLFKKAKDIVLVGNRIIYLFEL